MLSFEKHTYIITGHYGSGKSNFAVNLALMAKKAGRDTVLVDLDIVNPFFRSADCRQMLTDAGIRVITPVFANTNLDVPSLPATIDTVLRRKDLCVILDIGGDDAGSAALGRYAKLVTEADYEMWFIAQQKRFLTQESAEMEEIMHEIENASHLKMTGVINNTNLGALTELSMIEESMECVDELCKNTGLPLIGTSVERGLADSFAAAHPEREVILIDLYISYPY